MKKKVIRLNENDIENLVKRVIKEEYDNHMEQPSIIGDIEGDLMEMSKDEALEYLEDIIQYCMDKKQIVRDGHNVAQTQCNCCW